MTKTGIIIEIEPWNNLEIGLLKWLDLRLRLEPIMRLMPDKGGNQPWDRVLQRLEQTLRCILERARTNLEMKPWKILEQTLRWSLDKGLEQTLRLNLDKGWIHSEESLDGINLWREKKSLTYHNFFRIRMSEGLRLCCEHKKGEKDKPIQRGSEDG